MLTNLEIDLIKVLEFIPTVILPTASAIIFCIFGKNISKSTKRYTIISVAIFSLVVYIVLTFFGEVEIYGYLIACFAIIILHILVLILITSNENKNIIENEVKAINENKSEKYTTIDGVFAVSAIIITNNNKFILMQRGDDKLWVQPGTYYRTNKIFEKRDNNEIEMTSPFNRLKKGIFDDIILDNIKFIDFSELNIIDEKQTSELLEDKEDKKAITREDMIYNTVSPAPFLVQKEKSRNTPKSSGKMVHNDMFFAFRVDETFDLIKQKTYIAKNGDKAKCVDLNVFSLSEIREKVAQGEAYSDLYAICLKFMRLYRRHKFRNSRIRNCTFDLAKSIICLRVSDVCNANCKYCLRGSKKQSQSVVAKEIDIDDLSNVFKNESKNFNKKSYKFIITGGEPLLISNIFQCITDLIKIEDYSIKIKSISLCTNGVLWKNHQAVINDCIEKLENKKIFFKFVINMPAHDKDSYNSLTGFNKFGEVEEFIRFLKKENIDFLINVVMSDHVKRNLEKYVVFWKEAGIKNIALTYAIRTSSNKDENLLSKQECIDLYKEIRSGDYEIEHLDSIELILPNCNDPFCSDGNMITSIYPQNGKYEVARKCLDQIDNDNLIKESEEDVKENNTGSVNQKEKELSNSTM